MPDTASFARLPELRSAAEGFAASAPADIVEIRLERRRSTSLTYSGRELDEIGERVTVGGSVRAAVNGGWGFSSFNLPDDLERAVGEACQQARAVGRGKTRLKDVPPVRAEVRQGAGEDPRGVTLDEKRSLAESYNAILLSAPKIVSSRVSYLDRTQELCFVSSQGASVVQERVFTGITLSATARDGVNVQRAYRSAGDHRGFGNVRGLESTAAETAKRAGDLLSARKIEGGRGPVIIDSRLAGVFAHEAFGHMSEADFLFDNPAVAEKMKRGTLYGPEFLNIVDQGSLPLECGGYAYDDEGVATGKTYLLRGGRLESHLHSRESAEKMGEETTGNARALSSRFRPIVRMSCTYIEAGPSSFEEMIAGIPKGVYAVGMLGGNTDLEQFTFSAEYAFEIKDGKLGALLRDVILTGNLFETLHSIDRVGNDFALHGGMGGCGKDGQSPLPVSDGGPHVRIQNLLIG